MVWGFLPLIQGCRNWGMFRWWGHLLTCAKNKKIIKTTMWIIIIKKKCLNQSKRKINILSFWGQYWVLHRSIKRLMRTSMTMRSAQWSRIISCWEVAILICFLRQNCSRLEISGQDHWYVHIDATKYCPEDKQIPRIIKLHKKCRDIDRVLVWLSFLSLDYSTVQILFVLDNESYYEAMDCTTAKMQWESAQCMVAPASLQKLLYNR